MSTNKMTRIYYGLSRDQVRVIKAIANGAQATVKTVPLPRSLEYSRVSVTWDSGSVYGDMMNIRAFDAAGGDAFSVYR